jgi:uncharacterized protein (TIGR00251 family)
MRSSRQNPARAPENPSSLPWTDGEEGCLLQVRVQPKASATRVMGIESGRLKIKLMAPPVEGAANEALQRFLAKQLKIAPSRVRMVRGETSREKTLNIVGVSASELSAALKWDAAEAT